MGGLRRQRSVAHSSTPKGPISTCSTMHQSTTTTWSLQCSCSRRLRSDCIFLSRYYHIRELRCIRPYLDFKTASTIATSIVHSKLDYCNSLSYNLSKSQTNRLQVIQNSLARAVVKAPKFCHVIPILKPLHWVKINERIEYKLLSITYKALTTAQPTYLHSLISVQPHVLLAPHLLSPFLDHLHLLL